MQSVARGAVIVITMRWTDRLIGITSTLILARLLLPSDFGIVAMASLVVALIDTLLDLGVSSALIQDNKADHDDFNTAWTLRFIQAGIAALLIATLGAPLAASYFNDERVIDVLRIMALSVLFSGFENIGIVAFQKNMEFGRDFQFFFFRRVTGFAITIALAFWLRSYWAMVFGALAGRIAGVVLSYLLHEFRPHFSLARFSKLWSFSQWILVRNLGGYGSQQSDKLIVGRRTEASTLGAYTLADEISAMPTGELLMPLGRVLFPAFVRVADKPEELRRAFCLALGIQALVALPAGVGLALVAHTAVPLLLGPQWLVAIPFVQLLALMSIATALSYGSSYLLLALGKVRLQAILAWAQFGTFLLLTLLIFPHSPAADIAAVRLGTALLAMLLLLVLVLDAVPILKWRDFLDAAWRPIIATLIMATVLLSVTLPNEWPLALSLLAEVGLGGTVYVAATVLLWQLSGWQEGAESYLLDKAGLKQKLMKS